MRLRNPFRLRLAEHIEADATFLRLFEPSILDALPADALRAPLTVLRSAPGGGKTSILRLFSAPVLRTLATLREQPPFRDIADRLEQLGAIVAGGVQIIGVRISCAQSFADLETLGAPPPRPERLLFALLSARILIAALRELGTHLSIARGMELNSVRLTGPDGPALPGPGPSTAAGLLEWAEEQEAAVCRELDALTRSGDDTAPAGHDRLVALSLLERGRLVAPDDTPLPTLLVQLDDFHLLAVRQRQRLLESIATMRSSTPVWIAERLEAIHGELVHAQTGRDGTTVHLEDFWTARARKVEQFMLSIADRRAQAAADVEVQSFEDCLQASFTSGRWGGELEGGLRVVRARVQALDRLGAYAHWRATVSGRQYPDALAEAVAWRELEIHIARDLARNQGELFPEPRAADLLEEREAADIRTAAELFLCAEFKLPFYYGSSRLAALASRNVDQFLELAGDLFEEVVSASLLRRPLHLSVERQDDLVRKVARRWQEGIATRVRHGPRVQRLIGGAARMARDETFRTTAPYAPGVTGFAYAANEYDDMRRRSPELSDVLESAIADNVLVVDANARAKGREWVVFYLNRLLCAHFGLPLQYGGFREQRLAALHKWLAGDHTIQPQTALPLR